MIKFFGQYSEVIYPAADLCNMLKPIVHGSSRFYSIALINIFNLLHYIQALILALRYWKRIWETRSCVIKDIGIHSNYVIEKSKFL